MSKDFYNNNYERIRNAEAAPGEADREPGDPEDGKLFSYETHSLSGDGTNTPAWLHTGAHAGY